MEDTNVKNLKRAKELYQEALDQEERIKSSGSDHRPAWEVTVDSRELRRLEFEQERMQYIVDKDRYTP
jgi:hypothetical protein